MERPQIARVAWLVCIVASMILGEDRGAAQEPPPAQERKPQEPPAPATAPPAAVSSAAAGPAAAEPIALESRIVGVTLYSTQARVLREATFAEGAGARKIVLGPLPSLLEDDSIEVSGDPHLKVLGVRIVRESGEDQASPEYKALEQQVDEYDRQIRAVERRRSASQARLQRFMALELRDPPCPPDQPAPIKVQPESWQVFLNMVRAALEDALKSCEEAEGQVRDLTEKRDILRRKMDELARPERDVAARVHVHVQNLTGAAGTVRVAYRVPFAMWYPAYTLDIDPTTKQIEAKVYAVVHQRSGEEWPAVPLEFSTSVPEGGAGLPELLAQHITRRRYEEPVLPMAERRSELARRGGFAGRADDADADAEEWSEAAAPEPGEKRDAKPDFYALPSGCVLPIESARGFTTVWMSARPEAVPADGEPHRLLVGGMPIGYRDERTLVAELAKHVYRRLRALLPGDQPLLEGTAAVFYAGSYLGLTRVVTTAPGEEIVLDLGVDDRVRVERTVRDREEQIGIFSKADRYLTDVDLQIENFHAEPIEIDVVERMPFTDHEEIAVALDGDRTTPRPERFTKSAGIVRWKISCPAGERAALRLAYTIDAPSGFQLTRVEDPSRREEN